MSQTMLSNEVAEPETLREKLDRKVAEDSYLGYELNAARKLFPRLPVGSVDYDDLLAEIRIWTLEAVRRYDPERRAKFETVLYKHLNIRSLQFFNAIWWPRNWPKNRSICHFSSFEETRTAPDEKFDPTRGEDRKTARMEMREFIKYMSPKSRLIANMVMGIISDDLIAAFRMKDGYRTVGKLTGLRPDQVFQFVEEVRNVAPRFISSLA